MFENEPYIPYDWTKTEEQKREGRVCFTGLSPEKIAGREIPEIRKWLEEQIRDCLWDRKAVFITGMRMGVDLWAAETVLNLRKKKNWIKLIAVEPWPGYAAQWDDEWKRIHKRVWYGADYRKYISETYYKDVFRDRNIYMVNHSMTIIGVSNGSPSVTESTLKYAEEQGLQMRVKQIDGKIAYG